MKDFLGFEKCQKTEKMPLSELPKLFNEKDLKSEFDNRDPTLLASFILYYGCEYLNMKSKSFVLIENYSLHDKKFIIGFTPDEHYYRNIDGIRYRFFGATVDVKDQVKVIFINDEDKTLLVEYRPLLSISQKQNGITLRYYLEKQMAFDFLDMILHCNG